MFITPTTRDNRLSRATTHGGLYLFPRSQVHLLKTPMVRPEMIRRSIIMIRTMRGMTEMMVAAANWSKWVTNSVWLMVTKPTGRVEVLGVV